MDPGRHPWAALAYKDPDPTPTPTARPGREGARPRPGRHAVLLSWQYVPVKPLLQSQVNLPPDWLLHLPWGPQTLEEMYRTPSGVSLEAIATVQLSITARQARAQRPARDPRPRAQNPGRRLSQRRVPQGASGARMAMCCMRCGRQSRPSTHRRVVFFLRHFLPVEPSSSCMQALSTLPATSASSAGS